MDYHIIKISRNKKQYLDLLLLGDEQEIMIEFAKRLRTEDPKELVKEINQRLDIDDE